jgi:hypothetical protein
MDFVLLSPSSEPKESPNLADQAALAQYANARDQLLRGKIATKFSALCGFGIEP